MKFLLGPRLFLLPPLNLTGLFYCVLSFEKKLLVLYWVNWSRIILPETKGRFFFRDSSLFMPTRPDLSLIGLTEFLLETFTEWLLPLNGERLCFDDLRLI